MVSVDVRGNKKSKVTGPTRKTRRVGHPLWWRRLCQETPRLCAPRGSFFSFLPWKNLFSFLHFDQGSLRESSGGNWFHQPSIRSPHFRPWFFLQTPRSLAGARRPISL